MVPIRSTDNAQMPHTRKARALEAASAAENSSAINMNAIFEAETEFLASRDRGRTADGTAIPSGNTDDWYIRPVEGGPPPFRTYEDFRRAQNKWEKDIDSSAAVQVQLFKHSVVDGHGEPLGKDRKPLPKDTTLSDRMKKLIKNYQYEPEPREDTPSREQSEPDIIKWMSDYKPNAFTEFMARREKLLAHLAPAHKEYDEIEREQTSSKVEKVVEQAKKSNKKRQSSSDEEDVELETNHSKKRTLSKHLILSHGVDEHTMEPLQGCKMLTPESDSV